MTAAKRHPLPSDPNQLAKSVMDQAVGAAEPKPLPAHVTVRGDVAMCASCGKTFRLGTDRSAELRAFGSIHEH